jgi:hypothetical protein
MVLLFLGLVMLAERNFGLALLSVKRSYTPELGALNHPNCWHFRGLQHPRNLVKAFILAKSNPSEIIEVQLHPRACTDFSGGCRNCVVNQRWYARSLVVTLRRSGQLRVLSPLESTH